MYWHKYEFRISVYKHEPRTGAVELLLTAGIGFGMMEMLMHWKSVLCPQ